MNMKKIAVVTIGVVTICLLFAVTVTQLSAQVQTGSGRILIAYFSHQSQWDDIDNLTGASRVVVDGTVIGHVEHVANTIHRMTGGDLFVIRTIQNYPVPHRQLLDAAQQELRENARPRLASRIPNLQNYDTIFIGYPNWWRDMPMPLYSFLEDHNFEGKTIIPFILHGGSGHSGTIDRIIQLQPQASVVRDALVFHRNNLARTESEVRTWLRRIGIPQ
jgi:flavodoxin